MWLLALTCPWSNPYPSTALPLRKRVGSTDNFLPAPVCLMSTSTSPLKGGDYPRFITGQIPLVDGGSHVN